MFSLCGFVGVRVLFVCFLRWWSVQLQKRCSFACVFCVCFLVCRVCVFVCVSCLFLVV